MEENGLLVIGAVWVPAFMDAYKKQYQAYWRSPEDRKTGVFCPEELSKVFDVEEYGRIQVVVSRRPRPGSKRIFLHVVAPLCMRYSLEDCRTSCECKPLELRVGKLVSLWLDTSQRVGTVFRVYATLEMVED